MDRYWFRRLSELEEQVEGCKAQIELGHQEGNAQRIKSNTAVLESVKEEIERVTAIIDQEADREIENYAR